MKIFNCPPNNIKNFRNDRVQFKIVPHNLFLILCSLYLALYFVKIKFQQRGIWFVLHCSDLFQIHVIPLQNS